MDHPLAVEALLYRDGALQLDPAAGHYPAHFPPARAGVIDPRPRH